MAVTKIWTIKDSLQRVLDYAANPDKTEYDALAQTLHYAENDAKTKEPARYARMREAIDQACEGASTAEDFHRALYRQGYSACKTVAHDA